MFDSRSSNSIDDALLDGLVRVWVAESEAADLRDDDLVGGRRRPAAAELRRC